MKTFPERQRSPLWTRIGTRLFLLVLALAVPFAAYSVYSTLQEARQESQHAAGQMLAAARATAARLDDHIGDVRQLLKVMSVMVSVDAAKVAQNDALLRSWVPQMPEHVSNLTVWSLAGDNLGTIDPRIRAASRRNVHDRRFFREAVTERRLAVEAPGTALSSGQLIGIFALPIVRDGQVVGVVAASVRVAALQQLLNAEALPEGSLVTVISPERVVLARTLDPEHWVGRKIEPPSTARVDGTAGTQGREGTLVGINADGVERVGGYATAATTPWRVFVGTPRDVALAPVYAHLRSNLLTAGGMLSIGLLLAWWIGEGIASPLRRLSAEARELAESGLEQPIRTRARGEVGLLAATLDTMATRLRERTAALQASEGQLRHVTDNMPALISYVDRDERFRFANRQYAQWLGTEAGAMKGKSLVEFYGAEAYSHFRHHIAAALAGSRVVYERELATLQGLRQVEVNVIPDTTPDGCVSGLFVLINDVSAARSAQAELLASKRQLQMVADNIPAVIAYIDKEERFRFLNVSAEATFGIPAQQVLGRTCREVRGEALYAELAPRIQAVLRGERVEFEGAWTIAGRPVHYQSSYVPDIDAAGGVAGYYAMTFDITALKNTQRQLDLLARIDTLTGLPNRREFVERLRLAMSRSQRSRRLMALLFLDIDRFKAINDGHGHGTGDAVLGEFARRLQQCTRVTDTVARLAGDEFVVIVEGLGSTGEIDVVAEKIVEAVRQPMELPGLTLHVTCSLGYASYRGQGGDVDSLTAKADQALYRAKQAGRDTFAATNFAMLA